MIDRVLVNCWRAENTITVIKPWITALKKLINLRQYYIRYAGGFTIMLPQLMIMCYVFQRDTLQTYMRDVILYLPITFMLVLVLY